VRLQRFLVGLKEHFTNNEIHGLDIFSVPDVQQGIVYLEEAAVSGVDSQKYYFGGLTILPTAVKLSVAPARALTVAQAAFEGEEASAIHYAVRKGDVRLDREKVLGVKLGNRNKTPLAVVRGMLKSFVVDAMLRLDGASLNFSGVFLYNYTSTSSQLTTALTAHYVTSLRQNLPALVASMSAFGNPLGLVRGKLFLYELSVNEYFSRTCFVSTGCKDLGMV
jgi:Vacuolar-sorting-associated 13 protein C-terminal